MVMHRQAPKCGRHSRGRRTGARCTVTRLALRPVDGHHSWLVGPALISYAPACAAHLTVDERRELGLLPAGHPQAAPIPAPRRPQPRLDVAKLRAGDRD